MSSQKVPLVFVHERVYCRIVTILSDQRLLSNSVWTHGYDFFSLPLLMTPFEMITPLQCSAGSPVVLYPQQIP